MVRIYALLPVDMEELAIPCIFLRNPEPKPPSRTTPGFLILRKCDIINVFFCQNLLNLEVICYVAVDN